MMMSRSVIKRFQSLPQLRWLSNLSTGLCLLGLSLLGCSAEAAGFHARSCQGIFLKAPFVQSLGSKDAPEPARAIPLVSLHYDGRDAVDSRTFKISKEDRKPVETFVKERLKSLSNSLSHFDRMRIFDRVLTGQHGLFGEFGGNLVNALTMTSSFFSLTGYVSPQTKIFVHPMWGKLAHVRSHERAMMYHSVSFKSGTDFADSHRKKLQTEMDPALVDKEAGYLMAALRSQIAASFEFATEAYPIWKAASLNLQAKRVRVPFEYMIETSSGNYPLHLYSGPPVQHKSGTVASFVMSQAEMQTQSEFVRWLEENPAREEYAELMFSLGLDRLTHVLLGPNGGRVLNQGKEVEGIWRSKGFVEKTKAKLSAIGSDKAARAALTDGLDGLREVADALPYELNQSLIYESQLEFHKAAEPAALNLLWIDPNFDAFEEMFEGEMNAAKMMSSALHKQVRRVQTLREKMVGVLESGKVPWDLESNLALAEQDYFDSVDLVARMTVYLEKFDTYVSTSAQDERFVAEDTRAKFAKVEVSLKQYLAKFRERTRRDLAVLKLEVEKMRSTYEQSENFKEQVGPLRDLARSLWL